MTLGVVIVCTVWLLIGYAFFFPDPYAFERHFHLVNRADLETILKAEVFVNEVDNHVRVAHKILGYDLI